MKKLLQSLKSYRKLLIAAGIFLSVKLMMLLFSVALNLNALQLFSLEKDALSDLTINDVHYRLKSRISDLNDKEDIQDIFLINTGDLDRRYFRAYLAGLIKLISSYNPVAIGVDHDFSLEDKIGTESLESVINKTQNVVIADLKVNSRLKFDAITGDVRFPKNQETVRYYRSHKQSFAYQLALLVSDSITPVQGDSFVINYQSYNGGLSHINNLEDTNYYSNFKYINAFEILSNTRDSNFIKNLIQDKIIIVGHLGSICTNAAGEVKFDNTIFDTEDKYRVPCDLSNLYNRQKLMYGAVIHANALTNILNPKKRFKIMNGVITDTIYNISLFLFIFYSVFHDKGKAWNILILVILSVPLLYFELFLMKSSYYLTAGISLLKFLIVEEYIEVIKPIMVRFKFIRNELKQ